MLRDGYESGMGLGRNGDGTENLVKFIENRGRFSLGYKPTHVDKRRVALERKERSLAHLQGQGPQMERVHICHISRNFVSARWMHKDQVVVPDEETHQDHSNWVHPCSPGFELKNWQIMERPKISVSNPM